MQEAVRQRIKFLVEHGDLSNQHEHTKDVQIRRLWGVVIGLLSVEAIELLTHLLK